MYDTITWRDIAYQEEHGVLPDNGWDSAYIEECLASGEDPGELAESIRTADEQRAYDRIAELERENEYLRDALYS